MQKKQLTLSLIALLSLAVSFTVVYPHVYARENVQSSQSSPNLTYDILGSMRGMGGMDGGTDSTTPVQNPAFSYFEVGVVVLIGAAIVGISVSAYMAFSRTRVTATKTTNPISKITYSQTPQGTQNPKTLYPFVLKALTDEERKVVNLVASHDGKCLQKHIRSETGLSRLQTSRIITRLAKRGIVTLQQSGNTNEVALANWIKQEVQI